MFKKIENLLRCPVCGESMHFESDIVENGEVIKGAAVCDSCHSFPIVEGVLNFAAKEQADMNAWSKFTSEKSYDDFEQEMMDNMSESQKKSRDKSIDTIVSSIKEAKPSVLLDLCTGLGWCFRKIISNVEGAKLIISADLSLDVLIHDRKKFGVGNDDCKICYIACDASNLPLKDGSVDVIDTFAGVQNMGDVAESAINETSRVISDNGCLIETSTTIDKDSNSYNMARKYFNEESAGIFVKDSLIQCHEKYFKCVELKLISEGFGEEGSGDLIPQLGDTYEEFLLVSRNSETVDE